LKEKFGSFKKVVIFALPKKRGSKLKRLGEKKDQKIFAKRFGG